MRKKEEIVLYSICVLILILGIILAYFLENPIGKGSVYASFEVKDQCDLIKNQYQDTHSSPETVYYGCINQIECVDKNSLLIVNYEEKHFLWWSWYTDNNCVK